MTLADRARSAQHGKKGGTCTVRILLDQLDEAYRVDVQAAMDDPTIWSTTLADVLAQDGYQIASETLNRHRRGRCACPR